MPKKPKCQSCSSRWCRNHLFELRPLLKESFFKKIQKARFCPLFNKNSNLFYKSLPILNKDAKFYTPLFYLEDQQNFYRQNDERFRHNHMEKIQNKNSGTSQIVNQIRFFHRESLQFFQLTQLVPNNGRNKKFCSVCRETFQDYLEHIGSSTHKQNVHTNKFNGLIKEMENKYNTIRNKQILVRAKVSLNSHAEETNQMTSVIEMNSQPDLSVQKQQLPL